MFDAGREGQLAAANIEVVERFPTDLGDGRHVKKLRSGRESTYSGSDLAQFDAGPPADDGFVEQLQGGPGRFQTTPLDAVFIGLLSAIPHESRRSPGEQPMPIGHDLQPLGSRLFHPHRRGREQDVECDCLALGRKRQEALQAVGFFLHLAGETALPKRLLTFG